MQFSHGLSRARLPHPRRFVITCRDNASSVRGEDGGENPFRVSNEGPLFSTRLRVPEFCGRIIAGREDVFAIRRESDGLNTRPVSLER